MEETGPNETAEMPTCYCMVDTLKSSSRWRFLLGLDTADEPEEIITRKEISDEGIGVEIDVITNDLADVGEVVTITS